MLLSLIAVLCGSAVARAGDPELEEAQEEMRKAKVNMDRHEYEAAIGHYLVARSLAPESTGPYLGLGLAHAALGHCNEAVPVLQEYLRRKPTNPHPSAVATLSACQGRPTTRSWGRVVVHSIPEGAEVRVDDEDEDMRGRTPLDMTLPPGTHRIIVAKPGYRDEIRQLTVLVGQTVATNVTMQPMLPTLQALPKGNLSVKIDPVPARVTVNGMRVPDERRGYDAEVPAGLYQVVIEKPGYETVTKDVWVRIGQTASESITLQSAGPREAKRKAGIALGVILAAGVVATVIAVGVVYGTPAPPPQFSTVQNP
jgi:hypothetical protein